MLPELKKTFLFFILSEKFLLNSCATKVLTHDEFFKEIKDYITNNRPLLAFNKVYEFEERFPESPRLCELSKFRLKLAESRWPQIGIENLRGKVNGHCGEK
tara:strand:+ start:134 stop:436 length:303 start_codon:yes stop_codon:yes gene_type:complete